MAIGILPAVGNWYQRPDSQKFEVVALDEDDGIVEIQYFSGEVDEVDFEAWSQSEVQAISPPEDWTGGYGEYAQDDLGFADMNLRSETHSFPLEDFDRDD